jgi:beta,beta-carotene 9',10'-dioxygenase
MAKFLQGFASNSREAELANVPVRGQFPAWLAGSLLRTGPAIFEVGKDRFLHWFDGLGMLYRFDFEDGRVGFKSRLLESQNYKRDMAARRITTPQFGTNPKQRQRHRKHRAERRRFSGSHGSAGYAAI